MIRNASAVLVAAMMTMAAQDAAAQQDYRWNGRLSDGQTIEIRNIKGEIRATPSSDGQVSVVARRRGGDADRVQVQMVRRDYGVVICAVYPSSGRSSWNSDRDDDRRSTEPRDACNSGRGMNVRDNDADVEFEVRVPAGVKLSARNVSGDVEARGLRGPVDARSVSGDVHVSSSADVRAASVSGDVYASLGRIPSSGLEFRSVSGSVTLELPAGVDADFTARTLSGEIDSDFPISLEGRGSRRGRGSDDDDGWPRVRVGRDMKGRLGRGGPNLNVTTVSGDITLKRTR